MRYALIDAASNTVVNVIEMEPGADWEVPKGHMVMASDIASPADLYSPDTGKFTAPEAPPVA